VLTWTVGPVGPNQPGQASFAVIVAPDTMSGTIIANTGRAFGCVMTGRCTASVTSNVITHTAAVAGGVGLITKVSNPAGASNAAQSPTVLPGALITYTLFYTNSNPSAPLTTVVISDLLPANTAFVSCTDGCAHSSSAVNWALGTVLAGVTGQRQFTVRVNSSAPDGALIQNRANLISDQGQMGSNSLYHRSHTPYDLQLTMTNPATATQPGTTFTYTIAYTNVGPLTLSGVVITDYLGLAVPGEFSDPAMPYLTMLSSGWETVQVSANGGIYRRAIGTLGPNQTGAVMMVVRLSASVPYTVNLTSNRAVIADNGMHGYETNPLNQSATVNRPIQGPDLAMSNVQISPGPYKVGKSFAVSATVTNRGLTHAMTWQHLISPSISTNNWFVVELYLKPTGSAPSGPHDHEGGYCSVGVTPCDERFEFLYFVDLPGGLAPGQSVAVHWAVSPPVLGSYSLFIQADSGFWWLDDPAYGRALEYSELDNVASVGSISTEHKVYLPCIMRQ
jgi:uncharacterized repeat protein (TIGR01451 family)